MATAQTTYHIVLFGDPANAVLPGIEAKKRNASIVRKLRPNRPADKLREHAQGKVPFNLYRADMTVSALCPDRKDVLHPATVNADVNLVRFHLSYARHGGTQVILQRVTGDAGADGQSTGCNESSPKGFARR